MRNALPIARVRSMILPRSVILSRSMLLASSLILGACAASPDAGGADPASPEPARTLDPERVTKLDFYGGRCAGEPSADGVDGVTGVELEVGKTFVAELYFAGGTGYSWTARGYDESVVKITEQRSRPVRGTDAVGAKQMCTMNFTAQKAGRTRITFELKRPWETTEAPAEVRHTTIYVK